VENIKATATFRLQWLLFGGTGFANCEHPSVWLSSPLKAASISSSGTFSILIGFLLALIIKDFFTINLKKQLLH